MNQIDQLGLTLLPESTTPCEQGGLDFRPWAKKTKKDGSTFCVELAAGCKAAGFYGKHNLENHELLQEHES